MQVLLTAHVSAMYSAFLGIALAEGVPLLYSTSYVPENKWWNLNFILGIIYFIICLGIDSLWWKVIGLY